MAAKKKTSTFLDDLVPVTEEKKEFELSPVPDSLRQIRPTPSTTSPAKPKEDFKLDPDFVPVGEVRTFTDDELFRKIEGNLEYSPTDAELDKYIKYKEQNPTGAVDFIKGAWDGAWGVLGEIGSGAKAIVSEPQKSLDFFTAEGWERKAANISEGVARATWDLGTLGREFNELFGRLRDDELREEMKEMKLRQSNPDYRMKGAMGGEAYLSPEQKESLRKTFAVDYIKERISDDLDDIEETTDNFQKPVDQLKREFARRGLTYVEDATKRDYTTANYIDNILDDKQRKKLVDDFPNWMRGRQRDRWRRTRYMQKISERARRGDQTIIGEFFGPEFDEKFRKVVNPQVATLLSYAGGPPEVAGALATRIPRKGLTAGAALTDPIQTAPTLGGKATELAGKALRKGGEKVEQLGDYIVETPQRAAGVGALLGAAAARDLYAATAGAVAGAIEQRVGVVSSAGRALQSAGETAQAIGEVVGRPGGTEGILKAASRVAPTEETAKKLNTISFLDPAINLASDLGKGAATGSFVGLALAAPSEDAGVMGAGFGGGLTGGFIGAGAGRFLTKGALLRNQRQNDWEQFRQRLSPKQIESIKKYAPDINTMGQVMNQVRMLEGVLTPESRGNVDFDFLSPQEFQNRFGAARGVVVTGNRVKPEIIINTGWRGPNSLYHEAWHAMKRFAGTTEQVKVAGEGKQEQPVLQPYLKKIQTILFGEELGGQQVVKGLYDKDTILKDFADQYTDKMTDDQKAKWEDSFKQDPVTKEKFTPEQAEQNKLNYLMEELEAESFRYLMSGSDPRGIASGQRSITQKFVDHILLAEHSKTLRGMKKALSSVGIRFKGSGEPSDIFAEKDSKGRWRGLTNSPELNAALRDYVRAWEGLQYRTRYIDDVEPSGFQIGGQGVAGSRVVEFQLRKPENNFLREHFKSSDIIKKDDNGEPVLMPDGVTLQLLSEGQIRKLQEDRAELVKKALEDTEDPNGMTSKVNDKGEVSFSGVPTPRQLDAIDTIPSNILTPNQKQIIREVSTMMSDDPGAPLQFLYNAAIGRGKRYSSSLSSSHRIAVPLGFHVSKAQNFYFTSLDLGAYQNKLKAWADDTKKALHKGGHKLALWDKDVKAFEADLFKYLDNHKNGRPGETGLAPDQKTAEQRRNVLNDFFNINKGEDAQGTQSNFNPIAAARRAVDPKTGKQKKRAYRNLENLMRSYRLDRVLDEDFGKSLSYSLGKPLPMKSQADFYRRQLENFMALPNQQQGARFMPPPNKVPKGKKRLFNASTIERPVEYLEPHISDWVKEVAEGAGDVDPAEITSPLIYLSDDPGGWVSMIVSRKLGKPLQKVTVEDIRKHGRLNIVEADEDASIYKVGDQWETDEVTDLAGNRVKFYESAIYSEGDVFTGEGRLTSMPVGPEPPDFITNEAVKVDYSLTGDNLIRFLKENKKLKAGSEDDNPRFMPPPAPTTPQFKRFFEGSKVVDDKGEPLVVYSGHGNTELYGTKYDKNKGTAGGFYATEDPAVASSYAKGKMGGREFYEDGSEYRFKHKNGNWGKKIWQIELTPEQQAKAKQFLKEEAGFDIDKYWQENARYDRDANRARLTGGVRRLSNIHKFMESMGDTIKYADETNKPVSEMTPYEVIENQGVSRFEDLLNEIGIEWNAFDKRQPGVFPLYLSIKKPIDASKPFPQDVLTALKKSASRERPKFEGEYWTKDLSMKEFVNEIEKGSEYWSTQVPTKAKKIFQDFGYDGIKELGNKKGDGERQVNWIAFEPEQIKSIYNRGEFSPENPDIRFMPQPTFYSKAERAVEGAKAGIFNKEGMTSVGQAKALLEKNAPETELEWSGVLDYLDLQKEEGNKVSKQDLLSYLKNNGVEVEEVYRSGGDGDYIVSIDLSMPPEGNPVGEVFYSASASDTLGNDAKFKVEFVASGNYKVTRLSDGLDIPMDFYAPIGQQDLSDVRSAIRGSMIAQFRPAIPEGAEGPTLFSPTEKFAGGPAALPGGENYSELVLKLPDTDGIEADGGTRFVENPEGTYNVPRGHRFPEQNILAHIRFTERTDADGKRMLFLDEVQSDWNSEGRERGFDKKRPERVQEEIDRLNLDIADIRNKRAQFYGEDYIKYRDLTEEAFESKLDRMQELLEEYPDERRGVPNMPYKGSKWQDLVMKRMIRWAADNGYDRLGWITGKDTADRYDLSKVINEIAIPTVEKDVRAIRLETGKGDSFKMMVDNEGKVDGAFKASQFNGKQLDEVIGKELAEKVMAFESPGSLTGTDLKVGGEWASNLYDKSLPKIARKLTKKKGAVGRVGIYGSNGKLNGALAKNGIKPKYEANYVDISPEVKDLAQEGFSYFMPEGRGGAASAPVQTAAPQPPSGVIIPKVKLTEDEKEESRKLLQSLGQ